MGTVIFLIGEAIRGIYKAKLMTFISIVSIAVSLSFMSLIIIVFVNVETRLRKGIDQADMAAYIKDEWAHDTGRARQLLQRIGAQPSVRRAVHIDKDSAWRRFRDLYGPEMLEAVDENPLPASIEIYLADKARSQEEADRLKDIIGGYSEIESVRYSREWIDFVGRVRLIFWVAALVFTAVVNFILYFMISNTIKLTIYARKELIANMQMVGATSLFIKIPFMLEGILQGIIGGTLCFIIIGVIRLSLAGFPIFWGPRWLPVVIVMVGVIYGWMGSAGAVRKFFV